MIIEPVQQQNRHSQIPGQSIHRSAGSVIGRFAPSPTGPVHFGTLVSATASFLCAREAGGRWLLRIEDLDPPRVVAGAADALLWLLESLGFEWDGSVVYQSYRTKRYLEILEILREQGLVFDCNCTRREILSSAPHSGEDGPVYPGTCRDGMKGGRDKCAVRLRVPEEPIRFVDGIQGSQIQCLEQQVGDFVLYRADGLFAYQLAVVVDDMDAGVNQVVRGADLLSSTPRQIWLHRCLRASEPCYYHHPLVLGEDGKKFSKRDGAYRSVDRDNGGSLLWQALVFLGQPPPAELMAAAAPELLRWGLEHFRANRIPAEDRKIEV